MHVHNKLSSRYFNMVALARRLFSVATLFFLCGAFEKARSDPVYGLCELRDVIRATNGSLAPSKGQDCTTIILAPKGWRIKLTIYYLQMRDATIFIHDGGTRVGTLRFKKDVGVVFPGPNTFYTSSNALFIHTDRIKADDNKFNATFEMFPQPATECACPSTFNASTICSLPPEDGTGNFYFGTTGGFKRKCTTTCDSGLQMITTAELSANSEHISCHSDRWTAENRNFELFDKNLITCNAVNPVTQVLSVYTFTYAGIPCEKLNSTLIQNKVHEFLRSNTTASYVGECYKNEEKNCTVTPVLASCSTPSNTNNSLVELHVRDNIELSKNLTETRQKYELLFADVTANLEKNIKEFILNSFDIDGTKASDFKRPTRSPAADTTCPENQVRTGESLIIFPRKSCMTCPLHFSKHITIQATSFHYSRISQCRKCFLRERRLLNETMCVLGAKIYPEHSNYADCQHMCTKGKYFNKGSGLCEWCDFGQYQDSKTDLDPVCKRCPNGNTTTFVGARSVADCMEICSKGQYASHPSCVDCAIGYYMPYVGNRFRRCFECPGGKTTLNVASMTESDCVDKCAAGEYFNITQGICVLCPYNMFQDEVNASNTRSCKACPKDSVTILKGSTSSSACLGPCSLGEYLDNRTRRCEQCPSDMYNDEENTTSFMCKPCPKHKITESKGSRDVSQCIYTCSPGEFFNVSSEVCEKCAMNTFQNKKGKDSCMACTGNMFTLKTGSTTCIPPCDFGQFLDKVAGMCRDCDKGYFQNETAHILSMCRPCLLDFYADQEGSQNCTACPDGGITVVTAAASLSECIERCQPGYHLNKALKVCEKCTKGFYQDQKNYRYESCTKCPSANLTTLESGAGSREQCVGYCASSPCLNGASCTNIDNDFNCTCSAHLAGKQCENVLDQTIADQMNISIRLPDQIWNDNLNDPASDDFKKLAAEIEEAVREVSKNDPTFRTVRTKSFTQGSVISDLQFHYVAGLDFGNPLDTLKTATAGGKLGNFTVDESSLKVVDYTCGTPLGMENGRIPDSALSSANPTNTHPFTNARLNHNGPGWTPRVSVLDIDKVYLQVDFGEVVELTGIATQGSSYDGGQFLVAYRFDYSVDGSTWQHYKEDTLNDFSVLSGNDRNSKIDDIERTDLKYPVQTRYVRLIRYHTHRFISYRCEFYGCPIPKTGVLPTRIPPRTEGSTTSSTDSFFSTKPTVNSSPSLLATATTVAGSPGAGFDDDDDSNIGLILGVVFGVLVLVIVIGLAVWYLNRNKRSRSFSHETVPMK